MNKKHSECFQLARGVRGLLRGRYSHGRVGCVVCRTDDAVTGSRAGLQGWLSCRWPDPQLSCAPFCREGICFAASTCWRPKVVALAAAEPWTEEPFWPVPLFCRFKCLVFGTQSVFFPERSAPCSPSSRVSVPLKLTWMRKGLGLNLPCLVTKHLLTGRPRHKPLTEQVTVGHQAPGLELL